MGRNKEWLDFAATDGGSALPLLTRGGVEPGDHRLLAGVRPAGQRHHHPRLRLHRRDDGRFQQQCSPRRAHFTNVSDSLLLAVVPPGRDQRPAGSVRGTHLELPARPVFWSRRSSAAFSRRAARRRRWCPFEGANFVNGGTTVAVPRRRHRRQRHLHRPERRFQSLCPAGAGDGPITVITSAGTNVRQPHTFWPAPCRPSPRSLPRPVSSVCSTISSASSTSIPRYLTVLSSIFARRKSHLVLATPSRVWQFLGRREAQDSALHQQAVFCSKKALLLWIQSRTS